MGKLYKELQKEILKNYPQIKNDILNAIKSNGGEEFDCNTYDQIIYIDGKGYQLLISVEANSKDEIILHTQDITHLYEIQSDDKLLHSPYKSKSKTNLKKLDAVQLLQVYEYIVSSEE